MSKTLLFYCLASLAFTHQTYAQSSLIDKHFEALNNHDIKALVSEYTDDAEVFSPNWEGAKVGPAGITEAYTRYYKSTPDLTYTVSNTIMSGDNVIVEYSWQARCQNLRLANRLTWKAKSTRLKAV